MLHSYLCKGYFDLGCVEKSHSPAGKMNGMCENMNKKIYKYEQTPYKYGQKHVHIIR